MISRPCLRIGLLQRRLSNGGLEVLGFKPGVNLIVGPPTTGKTKWLQTLDYLLGDPGENPFEGAEGEGLKAKYDAAAVELFVGEERLWVERRWKEIGLKSKVFVNEQPLSTKEFQHLLLEKLGIPLLHFPKGDPFSGQTWPELSFRMLLRHIYRQQRFWGNIADQQPEGEQHACLLQFLGSAEHIYTADYGRLIELKREVEKLKSRREQYLQSIDEVSREVVSDSTINLGVNTTTVREAAQRLLAEVEVLRQQRTKLITNARNQVVALGERGRVHKLSEERADLLIKLDGLRYSAKATDDRLIEIERYRTDVGNELERMARVSDAAEIMADLRITHCPACDQIVSDAQTTQNQCFLRHQTLSDMPLIDGLGAVRLQFERDRLEGEIQEGSDLRSVLERDSESLKKSINSAEERLRMVENELSPIRQSVSALIQESISAIDMALGELNEKQRQLGRVLAALELGQEISNQLANKENDIKPLESRVANVASAIDFEEIAAQFEDKMNEYLNALNKYRPKSWSHSQVTLDISRYSFALKIGKRRWQSALGGTDTLYFLMAYHYGLLAISKQRQGHYPGFCIIDVPGEFAGEAVGDKENFIVQPFIDLLKHLDYKECQFIITGASFEGLGDVSWSRLTKVYVT